METSDKINVRQQAEQKVVEAFREHGYLQKEPMFLFHSFKFENLTSFKRHHGLLETDEQIVNQETDLIVLHRDIGVILVETKGVDAFNNRVYKKAGDQLEKAEKLLNSLHSVPKNLVKKVFAFPNLSKKNMQIPSDSVSDKIIHLLENDMMDFTNWWIKNIKEDHPSPSICKEIYCKLAPKLLCGRGDICVYLNTKTVKQLDRHETLKVVHRCMPAANIKPLQNVQTSFDSVKSHVYLTPEQHNAWQRRKQVICGPYGCGKTILVQCKAITLARNKCKVLVIVPLHLKQVYKNFLMTIFLKIFAAI